MSKTQESANTPEVIEEKVHKSIVPPKYGNKYKNGGSDDLASFINDQSSGKDGFEFTAFFGLCRKNGIAEEKVAHYEQLVDEKHQGAAGRARMTLRNMLAAVCRREGGLVTLSGDKVEIEVAKAKLPPKKAKDDKAENTKKATA